MILRRLHLRRFLGLADAAYDFAPGINVIIGPNEAGKSTLRTAIRTVLYENPATTSSELREKFRTWGTTDPPELVLEFELDGRTYRLTKNFAARRVQLTDSLGRTWEQHKVVQERLVEVLGLANDRIFDATAHIAQTELERIHLTSISKELGRVIGGGGEDVATAMRRLEAHIKALERGSKGAAVKEPGPLAALERRVVTLRAEVETLRRNTAEAERARAELSELTTSRSGLEAEYTTRRALLERNREILQDEERLAALKREEAMWEQKLRSIEALTARLGELDGKLERATARGVPDEAAIRQARTLLERAGSRERDLTALRRELEEPAEPAASRRRGWAAIGVGLALAVLGAVARSAAGSPALYLIGLGAVAAATGVILLIRAARAVQLSAIRRQERERQVQVLDEDLDRTRSTLAELLDRLGYTQVDEAEQALTEYRDLVKERRQVEEFLARLRNGQDDETIADRWKTLRRDVFGVEERLRDPEVAAKRMTPLQVQALEGEVRDLEQRLTQMQRREMKLTVTLERVAPDADLLAVAEEQQAAAEEELGGMRHHHEVCKEALTGLAEARALAEVPLRAVVERRAGEYLRSATGGRYTRLAVDQETLGITVWSGDAGEWVEAAEPHLSRGTVDLVYLAARLALVAVLTGGRKPPLLFDDPFITFDDRRRSGAAALLRDLAREHQVFLFTCTRHYDGLADRVVILPDRTTSAAAPAPAAPARPVGPLWEQTAD